MIKFPTNPQSFFSFAQQGKASRQVQVRRALFTIGDALSSLTTLCIAIALVQAHPGGLLYQMQRALPLISLFVGLRLLSFTLSGIYRISPIHTGTHDLKKIIAAVTIPSLLFLAIAGLLRGQSLTTNALCIDWAFNLLTVSGMRLLFRMAHNGQWGRFWKWKVSSQNAQPRRILLVGAGAVGSTLAHEIKRRSAEGMHLVGFLDDDASKQHSSVDGAPVLGTTRDIQAVVTQRDVDEVIITMPSAPAARVRDLTVRCEDLPAQLRISPGFTAINGEHRFKELRAVSVEDLLRREPVSTDMEAISGYLAGERVLITGAGGSIGSELVRQILAVGPSELLLLGRGENSIFEIEQEVRHRWAGPCRSLIANVCDCGQMQQIFEQHRPTVVFHAAAHKHVPLMEAHPSEAILNNIYGTRNVSQLASLYGVKRMVSISTDKAVNPTNVMGVSKRVAELVVQAESQRSATEFAMVRFGNVLGSRGSVVPLMHRQIAQGGPVTVTHPDVRRYFMTIPEAVQLVIQAGALGGDGNIYILDMGDPVRIIDLARDLIRLSGLVPDREIPIEIIGLRPGEKLFEELLTTEEGLSATRHERIFAAHRRDMPLGAFDSSIDALIRAARNRDTTEMVHILKALEPSYVPSEYLLKQTDRHHEAIVTREKQVA